MVKMLMRCLASVAVFAFCAPVHAQSSHGHHHAKGAAAQLGSSATFDATGVLWAVYKEGGHVMIRHSENLGRSWSQAMRINAAPEGIAAENEARPKIATGSHGELYATWTKPLAKPYTGEIRFARSLDQGKSFSRPVTVHKDRQEITHRFDAVTVSNDGQIFIAWIDKRDSLNSAGAKRANYRGAAVYFAVSKDRGESFVGDYRLAEHSCECCRIALLPKSDGSVLAMWRHVFAPNIRDHAIATMYADGHVTPVQRATFDDWRLDACPHHGPSLAADDEGRLHAVWFSQSAAGSSVFYGVLANGTIANRRAIGNDTAEHADIAAAGHRLAIVWKEFDGERSQLQALVSSDRGTTWQSRTVASTAGASDQPRVLARNDEFYAFWNTQNEPLMTVKLP